MKTLIFTMLFSVGLKSPAATIQSEWFKIKIYGGTWTIPLKLLEIRNDTLFASGTHYVETDEGFFKQHQLFIFPVAEIQRVMALPPDPFPVFTNAVWSNNMSPQKIWLGSMHTWMPWTQKYEIGGSCEKLKYLVR